MEPIRPSQLGMRVRRLEDPRFLQGLGKYAGDISARGMLHAAFARSPHARARVISVDARAALGQPGVVAAFTGRELKGRVKPIQPLAHLAEFQPTTQHPLADAMARFVGEPVAVVLAESRYLAEDGADLVRVEYEPLPPVTSVEQAAQAGSTRVHDDLQSNVLAVTRLRAGQPETAINGADFILRDTYRMQRHSGVPIEPRACVADYARGTGELTFWTSSQIPHLLRSGLARLLGIPENRIRVIAPDVGGGFGIKSVLYPEELALCAITLMVQRPVKWVEDRHEHLLSSIHARDHLYHVDAGFRSDGTFVGLNVQVLVDAGAYHVWPWTAATDSGMAAAIMPGPYKIQHFAAISMAIATNKTPAGPYRGVARPAATFVVEQIIDRAARQLALDPAELRRRNLVSSGEFPFDSITGAVFDSGSYVESLDEVLRRLDYAALRDEQDRQRSLGRYLGIGLATYNEQTAHGPVEWAQFGTDVNCGFESANVRIDPTGTVTVDAGIHSHGQGLETTLAQVVADRLGVTPDQVRVRFGDTSVGPYGVGTFGSRSAVLGGAATQRAADQVRAKVIRLAAHLLEIDSEDLEIAEGHVRVLGVPDRSIPIGAVARLACERIHELPEGEAPGLEATEYYAPAAPGGTYSNATHAAVVEIDPPTGRVRILRYLVVEDCGKMINPLIVDGQVHGGVAQGIGGALLEEFVYDEQGQLLDTTLMDYVMPTSAEIPMLEVLHLETPSPRTLGGFKGAGEGGTIAAPAAIGNAILDALRPLGVEAIASLPLSPERVRRLIDLG